MSDFSFVRVAVKGVSALLVVSAFGLAGTVQAAPPPAAPAAAAAGTPEPRILVIDRNAILRASKVGQSIVAQVTALSKSAETQFKAEGEGLRKESETLRQQIAILAPDVKAKKQKDFQNKYLAFQKKVQERQGEIQGGLFKARQQVEQALGPILRGLMTERHANLLLDRGAVVLGTINVDVTGDAVRRLDQKLPTIKVELTQLPPDVQRQLAAQAAAQQQGQ